PRSTSSKNSIGDLPSASRNSENSTEETMSANSGMATYSAPRRMRIDRSLGTFAQAMTPALIGSDMFAMGPDLIRKRTWERTLFENAHFERRAPRRMPARRLIHVK